MGTAVDTDKRVRRYLEAFAHKIRQLPRSEVPLEGNFHFSLASIVSVYHDGFKLNNLEITFTLAILLECDEEVARKFVKLLMKFGRNEANRNELLRELKVSEALRR